MRVLHGIESSTPDAGAAAIALNGLCDALRAVGIESTTISGQGATNFGHCGAVGTADQPVQSKLATHLVKQADLVHLHGWRSPIVRSLATAARKRDKPYVISPHGVLCNGTYNRRGWRDTVRGWLGEDRLVRRAAAVVGLNELEEHKLRGGGVNANIVLLPYGVSVSDYETSGRAPDESASDRQHEPDPHHLLLMLGPIDPIEGIVPLLKAFAEIGTASDGWKIALVGREVGEWQKMLEAAIRRKGGEDLVQFASATDPDAQRLWLSRASILAAPSLHIRCPISLLQAVAAGVPVIASRFLAPACLQDSIRVCEPTRYDVAAALRYMFGLSDEQRIAQGQRARKVVRESFDWSVLVDQYVPLYESVAQVRNH